MEPGRAGGGGGAVLGCKEKLLEQRWKQLQQSADGSGFGQGQEVGLQRVSLRSCSAGL